MRRIELLHDDLEPLYILGDFDFKSISHVHAEVSTCNGGEVTSADAVAKPEVNIAEHCVRVNTLGWYKGGRDKTTCSTWGKSF